MTITIRVTELELDLLKKKKEQTGKNTTEILKSAIYFTGVDETFVDNVEMVDWVRPEFSARAYSDQLRARRSCSMRPKISNVGFSRSMG